DPPIARRHRARTWIRGVLPAQEQEPRWGNPCARAVLLEEILEGRLAVAERAVLRPRAGELDGGGEEHRLPGREVRARRSNREDRLRAVRSPPVQEVGVHLHDDLAARRERHPLPVREAAATPPWSPGRDPVRVVQRGLDTRRARSDADSGPSEAGPPE